MCWSIISPLFNFLPALLKAAAGRLCWCRRDRYRTPVGRLATSVYETPPGYRGDPEGTHHKLAAGADFKSSFTRLPLRRYTVITSGKRRRGGMPVTRSPHLTSCAEPFHRPQAASQATLWPPGPALPRPQPACWRHRVVLALTCITTRTRSDRAAGQARLDRQLDLWRHLTPAATDQL